MNKFKRLARILALAFTPFLVFACAERVTQDELKLGSNVGGEKKITFLNGQNPSPYISVDSTGNLKIQNTNNTRMDADGTFVVGGPLSATNIIPSTSIAVFKALLRAVGVSPGNLGVGVSASSGLFASSSTSYVDVTNLSVTLITNGRPVVVGMMPAPGTIGSLGWAKLDSTTNTSITGHYKIVRGASFDVGESLVGSNWPASSSSYGTGVPCSSVHAIDIPSAGTYTYKIQTDIFVSSSGSAESHVYNCEIYAYEL